MDKVGTLATELGQETIDLVVLYNDVNVSQDTISNAESRYVAKRQAFLAGLAVWDRFNMEIYSPLTLADFDSLVITDLRAPYEDLKASATQWAQYSAFEDRFEQAFGQIQNGVRNRRDDTKVVEAENAALMVYLPDYNDMIKEIEDLLSGAVTSAPGQ
jgi:CRISPR/Cas system-associated endoribonuclease Cas2